MVKKGRVIMNARKLLLNAMDKLVSSKSLSDITVQNVLDEAEVSRYTFYKYFHDKYDLANTYYKDYVSKKILSNYNGYNCQEILTQIFCFVKDNKSYFANIVKSDGYEAFSRFLESFSFDFFRKIFLHNTRKKELSEEELFKLHYINGGCCHAFFLWLDDSCRIPPEEIASWLIYMTPSEFTTYQEIPEINHST